MLKGYLVFKRFFDISFSLLSILLFAPLMVVIAMFIKATSPGPIFYRGVRSGLKGKPFRIFKFRTMVVDAEKIGGPSTAQNDPRFIQSAKFLRKYKLDELPQLINILKGEMSFVGPRPQVEKYTLLYKGDEKLVLTVKPGLTDFASIYFINLDEILGDGNIDERYLKEIEPEKNQLRVKYVKEQSFLTDMKLIFLTVKRLLKF